MVDSGLARVPRLDVRLGVEVLKLERIGRDSADQRAGRAGRTAPGRCVRLWSRQEDARLPAAIDPEVRRLDLSRTDLEIRGWGSDPMTFGWFEAPSAASLERAASLNRLLGALDGRGLTPIGKEMLVLPLAPRLARLVIAGRRSGCLVDAAAVAALASERDVIRDAPPESGRSDIAPRLDALALWREDRRRASRRGDLDAGALAAVDRVAAAAREDRRRAAARRPSM